MRALESFLLVIISYAETLCYYHRMFSITMTRQLSPDRRSLVALSEMCRSAIESVSPRQLVCGRVRVKEGGRRDTAVMCVDGRDYALNQ